MDACHRGGAEEAGGKVLGSLLRVEAIVRIVVRSVQLPNDVFASLACAFQRHVPNDTRKQRLSRPSGESLVHHNRRCQCVCRCLQPTDNVRPQRPLADTHAGCGGIFLQLHGLIARHDRVDRRRAAPACACSGPRRQRLARETGAQSAYQPETASCQRPSPAEQEVRSCLTRYTSEVIDPGGQRVLALHDLPDRTYTRPLFRRQLLICLGVGIELSCVVVGAQQLRTHAGEPLQAGLRTSEGAADSASDLGVVLPVVRYTPKCRGVFGGVFPCERRDVGHGYFPSKLRYKVSSGVFIAARSSAPTGEVYIKSFFWARALPSRGKTR